MVGKHISGKSEQTDLGVVVSLAWEVGKQKQRFRLGGLSKTGPKMAQDSESATNRGEESL